MKMLNNLQRTMLRSWAINMTVAFRFSRSQWFGFDYTSAEEARFRAIAEHLSPTAWTVWLIVSVTLYLLIGTSLLILVFTQFQFLPFVVHLCLIILIAFVALPLAMGVATGIIDFLFRIPPFKEADGDAKLYAKIRGQLMFVAVVAIISVIVVNYVQAVWNPRA